MLAYHAHEKAIMTVIIPLSLVCTSSKSHMQLFLRTCTIGHFGLFPLLFRGDELLIKVSTYLLHVLLSFYVLGRILRNMNEKDLLTKWDNLGLIIISVVFIFCEIAHPLFLRPRNLFEFFPLMVQSISCAVGLIICWIQSFFIMMNSSKCII